MHKFTALGVARNLLLPVVLVLGVLPLEAMEHQLPLAFSKNNNSTGNCSVFNFNEELEAGGNAKDVFKVGLLVTPDQKHVLIGRHGKVRCLSMENNHPIKKLTEHEYFVDVPMMAVANREKGDLLVCSAGNYIDRKHDRYCSEYILYSNGVCSKPKKLDSALQAIALDKRGKWLVLAEDSYIRCVDVDNPDKVSSTFRYRKDISEHILSIDITRDPDHVVIALLNGDIQLRCLTEDGELQYLKVIEAVDNIKQIYYSTEQKEIVYKTKQHVLKGIDLYTFVEYHAQEGQELSHLSFNQEGYDKIFFDKEDETGVCMWNKIGHKRNEIIVKKKKNSKENIVVVKKGIDKQLDETERRIISDEELYICEAPLLAQKYFYTKNGIIKYGLGHFCAAALCRNMLAALATDGKLYWWNIPYVAKIAENDDKQSDIGFMQDNIVEIKPLRKSGFNLFGLKKSDDGEKRKYQLSPRVQDKNKSDSGYYTNDDDDGDVIEKKSSNKKKSSPRVHIELPGKSESSPTVLLRETPQSHSVESKKKLNSKLKKHIRSHGIDSDDEGSIEEGEELRFKFEALLQEGLSNTNESAQEQDMQESKNGQDDV